MRLSIKLYVVCVPLLFQGWLKYCSTYCRQPASLSPHLVSLYERRMYVCMNTLEPPYEQDVTFSSYDEPLVSFLCQSNLSLRVNYHNATSLNVLNELRLRQIVRNL
jgi:hypothetical protein